MSGLRNTRSKWLASVLASALVLTVVLSYEPAMAGTSDEMPVGTFSASINVPLNDIQEGQWCVAYANVYGYTGPLEYLWGGSYYLGQTTQVVGAYMWGTDGYVTLRVVDKGTTPHDTTFATRVDLDVESGHPYNPECEA